MQQQLTMDLLRDMDKSMTHRSRLSSEETYYCEMCEVSVWGGLFRSLLLVLFDYSITLLCCRGNGLCEFSWFSFVRFGYLWIGRYLF